jgi:hypothetical protein
MELKGMTFTLHQHSPTEARTALLASSARKMTLSLMLLGPSPDQYWTFQSSMARIAAAPVKTILRATTLRGQRMKSAAMPFTLIV